MRKLTVWHRLALAIEKVVTLVFRRHVDYMITIRAKGRVVDAATALPLARVQVQFLDTSFDSRRAKTPEKYPIDVTMTGDDGTFDETFRYLWSANVLWLSISRVGRHFQLRFQQDGYSPFSLTMNPWELPYEDNVLQAEAAQDVLLSSSPSR